MSKEIIINGPHKSFEEIKEIDGNGVEFWMARKLFPLLGYSRWETFDEVILRSAKAALNSGQIIEDHFRRLTKMVEVGSGGKRAIKDWKLDRYACYLVAQNGDSKISQIAMAQTYFAIQTRRQEIFDKLPDTDKRLFTREEVSSGNKRLFRTAKEAGVSHFGLFNDAGYKGLYGLSLKDLEIKKGIKKGELLDKASASELAANLFRITQTDDKLKIDKIKGDTAAQRIHNMIGGKVRQTIKDIGGVLPENLKPEKHIKEIKREKKLEEKRSKKLITS